MLRVRAQITFKPDPGKYARRFGEVTRAAHYEGAVFWHHEILPLHFQSGAARRYHYKSRSGRYKESPAKQGKPSLVLTGTAQEMATGRPGIKAYPKRVRIELSVPPYIRWNRGDPKHPDMPREIFAVIADEQRRIEVVEQREAERQLKRMGETRTVTIG